MVKRTIDIFAAVIGLAALSPVLLVIVILVSLHDFGPPFYRAFRVGKDGKQFRMLKFRTMIVSADRTGVMSTAGDDPRITPVGRLIRRVKFDEFTQLYNVLIGDMSLVGPRPNVPLAVAKYSDHERRLLSVRPGITDFASIIFSDESEILRGRADPDQEYDRLIRPWKSELGIFYIVHRTTILDLKLVGLTLANLVSRRWTLDRICHILEKLDAPKDLLAVSLRRESIEAMTTGPTMLGGSFRVIDD